jgi:ADP-heptose:LPS heptosyltransferase
MGASDTSPRILITRLSHLGDCLHALPLVNALREQFPRAFLCWVVERPAEQLLDRHPALDRLIVVEPRWLKSWRTVQALRRELRSLDLSIAIDPQSLSKTALVARLSGASRRIGFARPSGRELAPWLHNELVHPRTTHVVDRYLELALPLGIREPRVRFDLPQDAAASAAIAGFVRESHLGCGFAVMNPGAGWKSRLWSNRRYGLVARELGERRRLPSVVAWAGPEERRWAEEIVAHSGGHALLAPPTNLRELAALLRTARLFLGSDTGPLHLAAALGTPCVSLHGTTQREVSGPYGPGHVALQAYYHQGSSRQRRAADNRAMLAIDVESVGAACGQILAQQRPRDAEAQAA